MYFRNRSQKVELLRGVPMLASLSNRHLQEIARHADELHWEAGRPFVTEGVRGQELFVIAQGKATVQRHGKTIAKVGPGDFVGELSLLDHKPRTASVVADEPMVLLVISDREFKPLLEAVPRLAEALLKSLAARLRSADEALD